MCGGGSYINTGCNNRAETYQPQPDYSVKDKSCYNESRLEFEDAIHRNKNPSAPGEHGAPSPNLPASQGGSGDATALDGMVTVSGEGAERVAEAVEFLYDNSETFRDMVDEARAQGETAHITFEDLGGYAGLSSLGKGNEDVKLDYDMITADEEQLLSVVSHELGHAFGDYEDGPSGGAGENQSYNSKVGYDLGYIDTPDARPYDGTLWG